METFENWLQWDSCGCRFTCSRLRAKFGENRWHTGKWSKQCHCIIYRYLSKIITGYRFLATGAIPAKIIHGHFALTRLLSFVEIDPVFEKTAKMSEKFIT